MTDKFKAAIDFLRHWPRTAFAFILLGTVFFDRHPEILVDMAPIPCGVPIRK